MRYATVEDLEGMELPLVGEERAAVALAVTQLAAVAEDTIARRYRPRSWVAGEFYQAGRALAQGLEEGVVSGGVGDGAEG